MSLRCREVSCRRTWCHQFFWSPVESHSPRSWPSDPTGDTGDMSRNIYEEMMQAGAHTVRPLQGFADAQAEHPTPAGICPRTRSLYAVQNNARGYTDEVCRRYSDRVVFRYRLMTRPTKELENDHLRVLGGRWKLIFCVRFVEPHLGGHRRYFAVDDLIVTGDYSRDGYVELTKLL